MATMSDTLPNRLLRPRRAWVVALLGFLLAGAGIGAWGEATATPDATATLVAGADSTRVVELQQRLPQGSGSTAIAVFSADDGHAGRPTPSSWICTALAGELAKAGPSAGPAGGPASGCRTRRRRAPPAGPAGCRAGAARRQRRPHRRHRRGPGRRHRQHRGVRGRHRPARRPARGRARRASRCRSPARPPSRPTSAPSSTAPTPASSSPRPASWPCCSSSPTAAPSSGWCLCSWSGSPTGWPPSSPRTSWPRPASAGTSRPSASSPCSSSARAPTTPCCSSPATATSCGARATGMPRWPEPCVTPARRSSPAPPPWSSDC